MLYLKFFGMEFLDSVGHVQSYISIGVVVLRETIREYALLLPIRIDIFHCIIREMYLLCTIRVLLLALLTAGTTHIILVKCSYSID